MGRVSRLGELALSVIFSPLIFSPSFSSTFFFFFFLFTFTFTFLLPPLPAEVRGTAGWEEEEEEDKKEKRDDPSIELREGEK